LSETLPLSSSDVLSPDPKSIILDICQVNPRQLVPTVGTLDVGIMDSMAFSLLSKDQEKNLTIGSLSFFVGSSGSVCLSDPVKSGLSARDTTYLTTLEASVGSYSEENSPVSTKSITKYHRQGTR
jgi:hypothetical protein